IARTNCGTSTTLNTPPATRMYIVFGTVLDTVNTSALMDTARATALSAVVAKPVIRDTMDRSATTRLALSRGLPGRAPRCLVTARVRPRERTPLAVCGSDERGR